jgi:HPt (histidine-containing phosphotransfer) domain-containing protein
MIDRSEFNEQFKYYDREVVAEIIDLFLGSYEEQLLELCTHLAGGRLDLVNMHAHTLKGLAATFVAPDAKVLASQVEEQAGRAEDAGLSELITQLESAVHDMAGELKKIREEEYC